MKLIIFLLGASLGLITHEVCRADDGAIEAIGGTVAANEKNIQRSLLAPALAFDPLFATTFISYKSIAGGIDLATADLNGDGICDVVSTGVPPFEGPEFMTGSLQSWG
jgi:hypothetical protein